MKIKLPTRGHHPNPRWELAMLARSGYSSNPAHFFSPYIWELAGRQAKQEREKRNMRERAWELEQAEMEPSL